MSGFIVVSESSEDEGIPTASKRFRRYVPLSIKSRCVVEIIWYRDTGSEYLHVPQVFCSTVIDRILSLYTCMRARNTACGTERYMYLTYLDPTNQLDL